MKKYNRQDLVSEIVRDDYRTAVVFRLHRISYCCGAHIPLELACRINAKEPEQVISELENATRPVPVTGLLKFDEWDPGFLSDYLVHVHHGYLKSVLPMALGLLQEFAEGHSKKFPWLHELVELLSGMNSEISNHIRYEEEIIFPYIRQIWHAYTSGEPFTGLLVRTLSKPVESVMDKEHQYIMKVLTRMRELTQDYSIPSNACASHRVSFEFLRELDQNMVQHLYLENNVLFPKAIQMEKELLQKN